MWLYYKRFDLCLLSQFWVVCAPSCVSVVMPGWCMMRPGWCGRHLAPSPAQGDRISHLLQGDSRPGALTQLPPRQHMALVVTLLIQWWRRSTPGTNVTHPRSHVPPCFSLLAINWTNPSRNFLGTGILFQISFFTMVKAVKVYMKTAFAANWA